MSNSSILVIKHGALGDLMQAMGVMKDIRLAYPQATISLLTSPAYISLMKRCSFIDQILVDNREPIWKIRAYHALGKLLNQHRFDLVIDLQNSERTFLYHFFWFRKKTWLGRGFTDPAPSSGFQGMVDVLEKSKIPTVYCRQPDLSWMVSEIDPFLNQWEIKRPYVVLVPGSSAKNKEKRWSHYSELAQLLEGIKLNVVCVVGPDESDLIASFTCKVLQSLDWFTLASLLKSALFVIGNDTGPTHIAAHVGANGVAIFGPNNPAKLAQITRDHFESLEVKNLHDFDAKAMLAWLMQRSAFECVNQAEV